MATFRICKSFFITPAFNERFKKAAEKADKTQLGFFIEAVEEKIDRMGFEWSNRENGLHDFQGNAESID